MLAGNNRYEEDAPRDPPVIISAGSSIFVSRRRLLIWTLVVGSSFAILRWSLPYPKSPSSATFVAFDLAFCSCAALAASLYCFSTFAISRALRDLLASVGFSALSGAAVIQAIIDLGGSGPYPHERIMTNGLLYASCAFFASSLTKITWRPETRAGSWIQLATGFIFLAAFPLVTLLNTFADIASNQPQSLFKPSPVYADERLFALAAMVLVIGAIIGHYRNRQAESGCGTGAECYFYIALAFAILAKLLSVMRFDIWWMCSQVLFMMSWLVFMSARSVENAAAHKENADRLKELEALHEISWSLVGVDTVRELANLLTNTVRDKLGASIVAVYLADETRESLELAAIAGPDICLKSLGQRYKLFPSDPRPGFHSGHTARAFVTKQVQVARDVFVDVELVPWRIIAREDGCAVSLPLVDKGDTIGVLSVYFSDHKQLSQQRLKLLHTITAAVTPAIRNARSTQAPQPNFNELGQAA